MQCKTPHWQQHYQAPTPAFWTGRRDSLVRERFFQIVELLDLTTTKILPNNAFCLLGFACDAGVIRNLGNPGAKTGPQHFRQQFAKLANHLPQDVVLYDCGDIVCHDDDLENAQKSLAVICASLLDAGLHPIVIGGGHETAWGHFQGIMQFNHGKPIGIINFDAHYDLRPLLPGNKGSSGTPFLQMANYYHKLQLDFDYFVIGIQELANTASLFTTAKNLGVKTIFANQIHHSNNKEIITQSLANFMDKHQQIYLTLCLDVFANVIAPGVSAPQVNGLWLQQVLPLLEFIVRTNKIISFDIVELAPPLDQDNKTAQLAAHLVANFLKFSF